MEVFKDQALSLGDLCEQGRLILCLALWRVALLRVVRGVVVCGVVACGVVACGVVAEKFFAITQ